MRVKEFQEISANVATEVDFRAELPTSPYFHSVGHGLTGYSKAPDVLAQLKTNLAQLEDLQGRLRFMVTEVKSLIVKS